MASSSGTLLQYFKQPLKKPENSVLNQQETDCVIVDDEQTPPSSAKRKNELNSDGLGKRRKLSLLSLRTKQANIVPLEQTSKSTTDKTPTESFNGIDTETKTAKVTPTIKLQSVKDVLFNHKKSKTDQSKECQEKDGMQTDDPKKHKRQSSDQAKECNKINRKINKKQNVKLNAKPLHEVTKKCRKSTDSDQKKESPEACSPEEINKQIIARVKRSLNISDFDHIIEKTPSPRSSKPRKSVKPLSESDEEMVTTKSFQSPKEGKLNIKLNTNSKVQKPVEKTMSHSPRTSKPRKSVNVLSDSDEEMVTTKSSQSPKEGKLNIKLNTNSKVRKPVEKTVSPSPRTSKPKKSVKGLSDSDEEMISTKSSQSPKEELNTSRRSSRVRKPVERFTVDVSDHEEEDKKQQRASKRMNKSGNKKNKENTPPSDDIMLIEDIPPPRKSVSSVLGKAKGKAVPTKPSVSSTTMMQEAKKLMQATRASPIHIACPASVSSTAVTTTATSSTAKKLEDGKVIWPTISHVNLNTEIIIYPLKSLDIYKEEDISIELRTDGVYKVQLDNVPYTLLSKCCDKSYDECVEELATNHPQDNIEDAIEYYRNITRREEALDEHDMPWSQLYCPTDYKQCIGNKATVKQLYKWLDGWKTKLLNVKKRRDSSSDSDSDFVAWDEEEKPWLENVVLLRGPNGAGKSGAIATCAAQLGYKIMELNASSERTGKNLAELFSEASQSHSVTGARGAADFTKIIADIAAKNIAKQKSNKNSGLHSFFNKRGGGKETPTNEQRKGKRNDVINIDDSSKPRKKKKSKEEKSKKEKKEKPLSLKKPRPGQGKLSFGKSNSASSTKAVSEDLGSKVEKLSLIVLEEIDIAFEDDRGFYPGIVALMQIAKRPIILTSNNPNLCLPTDAEFLVLKFNPPKPEGIMLRMGTLSLSYNNYIPPYQLQQYIQYYSADLHKIVSNLEYLNVSSPKQGLSELPLTAHLLGISNSLNSQRAFLEQTQSANLQIIYLNLNKLLRTRSSQKRAEDTFLRDSRSLCELVTCHDTFLYLDMLSPKSHCREFALFPSSASPALTEQEKAQAYAPGEHQDYLTDELLPTRVHVENQLLTFLHLPAIPFSGTRLNSFKLKEEKTHAQVGAVLRGVSAAVTGMNLLSRGVVDELSALRSICRTEQIKEDSGAKRRFTHYLEREVEGKDRVLLSKYWLGS